MTERRKDLLFLGALLAVLLLLFGKILFTTQIIRAPDITAEFYWMVNWFHDVGFGDLFKIHLRPEWNMFINSGATDGGSNNSLTFLIYRSLIFWLVPSPANIAWFVVFHLFFGGVGTYLCCRVVGCSRTASLLGGIVFAAAPEIASLINAGHVQKIATISFTPWAFYFFERGFQTRRVVFFLTTAVTLAFQFFNMHWQVAFYTCLGIGFYGVCRSVGILLGERRERGRTFGKLFALNLATFVFFLSTVAISLVPVADWSKDTTRGVGSGANQGQGGLNVEEAMSWSLPPEELASFVIPGFFGLSRQEGGYNGTSIDSYYWGRMVFTQTTDYLGLLPWLLLPLPLLFRRDRYTWLSLAAVVLGLLFSMGKYTPFYWFLYEHFPGINHFRVPKMIMFLPVLGMAVLSARGVDLLVAEENRYTPAFRRYLFGLMVLPIFLLAVLGFELAGKGIWLQLLDEIIAAPTRFEQGPQLVAQRWHNLLKETGIAALVAAFYAAAIAGGCRYLKKPVLALPLLLISLYLADIGRINHKFMLLQPLPKKERGEKTPTINFLSGQSKQFRTLPLNGTDPMHYVANNIPVFFTSNPVQMQRWQNYLDSFDLASPLPDIMNVKYLVYGREQYEQAKGQLGDKFVPVFRSPDGAEVVVENRRVLPKEWLVSTVYPVREPLQALAAVASPAFDPHRAALVESPPPIPLDNTPGPTGEVQVSTYEANRIDLAATINRNALLVIGEKYAKGWRATVDGKAAQIYPVDYVLRGVYLTPGAHTVSFAFDPLPFKVGKYLTLGSLTFFVLFLLRGALPGRRRLPVAGTGAEPGTV